MHGPTRSMIPAITGSLARRWATASPWSGSGALTHSREAVLHQRAIRWAGHPLPRHYHVAVAVVVDARVLDVGLLGQVRPAALAGGGGVRARLDAEVGSVAAVPPVGGEVDPGRGTAVGEQKALSLQAALDRRLPVHLAAGRL